MTAINFEQGPTIHGQGRFNLGPNQIGTVDTASGGPSVIQILADNSADFIVNGAPNYIFCQDGSPLNGKHGINPDQPLVAMGNFAGSVVHFFDLGPGSLRVEASTF